MDGFDPDAYLAAKSGGGTAVAEPPAFDPDAYLQSKKTPPERYGAPEPFTVADEQAAAAKVSQDHPILENLAGGIIDTASGLVPRSVGQAAGLLTPVVGAVEGLAKQGRSLSDILFGGKSIEEAERANFPESFAVADAQKTPPFSRERFAAGLGTIANMAMAAGGVRGLTAHLFPDEVAPVAVAEPIAAVAPITPAEEAQIAAVAPPEVPPNEAAPIATAAGPNGAEAPAGETLGLRNEPPPPAAEPSVVEEPASPALDAAAPAEQPADAPSVDSGVAPDEPPVPEGHVRIYHGANGDIGQAGRDFTTSKQYAQGYADKSGDRGRVYYVDVPEGTLKTHDEYGVPMSRVIVPDEISAQATLLPKDQPAEPEAVRNGIVPAERVVGTSSLPNASELSPQALGVTHPMPGFIKSIADYFTTNSPSQIWNTMKGSLDSTLGKTFAKTTIADRESGELGARWISARIAAPHLADTFASQVLGDSGVDPVKFGAALTEDNLRSIRQSAEAEGRTDDASKVTTIIGSKNSPFKTEAEYKSFLADPATQQAIERHRALWSETVDPMFRKAQTLEPDEPLPSRGAETGARINLYNDTEGTGKDVVSGTGKGNLTATFRKKSPFAVRAAGTGQSYNVNYLDQMRNTFGRQLEIAAKNDFETKLVDSGNAIIGKPGEAPTLPDGEKTVSFPLKRTTIITADDGSKVPVNQNLYVRKSLSAEYRNAANVDRYDVPAVVKGFADLSNKSALAGLTDASVHGLNLMTALFTRPSVAGGALSDSLLSTLGRADVPVTLTKVLTKSFQDTKAQVAELAAIGAAKGDMGTKSSLKNPLSWPSAFIHAADKSTRLVLDDAFKKMADAGLVENTETNRREFINQVGQYNLRAQGGLRRIARETGIGPFATAGTTFNSLGARTATLSPGVTATSPMAAAALRANVLSKWVGASVLVGTLNYLLTKDKGGGVLGRPGVPVGKIDTGLDDENGRPLSFPAFDLLGLGRAMRVTGARGVIESQKKGLNLATAFDASARDIANSSISPFAGPIARFGTEVTTGYQPAINVGRATHVAPPGENQFAQNLKDALLDANPILKSLALAREPGGTAADAARQQIPRLSLQPSQRPEFIEKYPEIVHKAQASAFIDDVIHRARNMKPDTRTQFVNDSLDKLDDEDRAHAEKTLKYRKIDY